MSYWEEIKHPRFFGRVHSGDMRRQMPKDLAPLVEYLVSNCDMAVEAIYLENYRLPEKVVVMDRPLPLDELQRLFPAKHGVRYTKWGVTSDATFSQLVGPQG